MPKTVSVKSSSVSSEEKNENGLLRLFSWNSLYKLCQEVPYFNLLIWLRLFEIMGYVSLSLDPDYAWGPKTKQFLIYFHTIFLGLNSKIFDSIIPMIVSQIVAFLIIFALFLGIRYVLTSDNPNPKTVLAVQVPFYIITQVISLMLRNIIIDPWRCDYKSGNLLDFPEYKCFETPNLIFFILSFASFAMLTLICFVKNLL